MPTLSDAVTGAKGRVLAFVNIVLGPWPIRTVPLALFAIAAISFSQTTLGVDEVLAGGARRVWFSQIPRTILIAGLIVLPLVVSEFIRHSLVKRPLTRAWYLISLAIASLIYPFIMFSFFATQPWSVSQDFDLLGWSSFRWFVVMLAVFAILGFSQRRLALEVKRANEATAAVLSQKELLVRSEEASRRSVAEFLHDRVQAMLVTSTMQLREIAQRTDDQSGSELRSVAEHLDDVRVMEVREANTRLSPNIAVTGLESSIRQLLTSWTSDLQAHVTLDPSLSEWATPSSDRDLIPIGVFRIIEQAAANAVIHGRASRVDVHLTSEGKSAAVRIQDNGSGLPEAPTPGSGTAIIESWVEMLRGTWTRSNRPEGGVEVLVRLPTRRP
ncbi:MAG TPA: ATP-binding protein [Candidatus Nanopelagicales bacterium]|nr:ATP-binding protein [Candidatus Nanopelagicales bacterium]